MRGRGESRHQQQKNMEESFQLKAAPVSFFKLVALAMRLVADLLAAKNPCPRRLASLFLALVLVVYGTSPLRQE